MNAATKTTEARGRVRVEHGAKRIRAYLGGELIADTTRPLLVWEKPYYPTYYFPAADVRTELLSPDGGIAHSPSRGDGHSFTVTAGCDKQFATCQAKFNNPVNFRGFPHIPGNDFVTAIARPGNPANDGGSLSG